MDGLTEDNGRVDGLALKRRETLARVAAVSAVLCVVFSVAAFVGATRLSQTLYDAAVGETARLNGLVSLCSTLAALTFVAAVGAFAWRFDSARTGVRNVGASTGRAVGRAVGRATKGVGVLTTAVGAICWKTVDVLTGATTVFVGPKSGESGSSGVKALCAATFVFGWHSAAFSVVAAPLAALPKRPGAPDNIAACWVFFGLLGVGGLALSFLLGAAATVALAAFSRKSDEAGRRLDRRRWARAAQAVVVASAAFALFFYLAFIFNDRL